MKTSRIILGSVALFSCIVSAELAPETFLSSQKSVITLAKEASSERFPDADVVLVDNVVFSTYTPEGAQQVWDDSYTKILTEKGRRDSSTVAINFNARYGKAEIVLAEIIRPDGTIIPVDLAASRSIVTDNSSMDKNIYDPMAKIVSCAIPGLQIGDVCHVRMMREMFKARMADTWADMTLFEFSVPIQSLTYYVDAPDALPLRNIVVRHPVKDSMTYTKTTPEAGRTLHCWSAKNVPQMFPEPAMPPIQTQVQALLVSTIPDWKTVSRWYWNLCKPALENTIPEIQTQVDTLIAGSTTREEKIRRIFKFVSQEIRYMGITTEDNAPGYEPHAVSLTFKNRYGVCRDKAALLATMLRMAGIPAYPTLIHAGAKMDPDVPLPYFNHAITAVDAPDGKGYILMDPTDENTRDLFPAYLANRSYLVARADGETLLTSPVMPVETNLLRIITDGTMDAAGTLMLNTSVSFAGINDNAYRAFLVRQKPEERRKTIEHMIRRAVPGAELLTCSLTPTDLQDTEQPMALTMTYRIPDVPVRGEAIDVFTIPFLGNSFGIMNAIIGRNTTLAERKYDLAVDSTYGVSESISLDISAGLGRPYMLPDPVSFTQGGLSFHRTLTVKEGILSATRKCSVDAVEFTPALYKELKTALKSIETAGRIDPMFCSSAENNANQHTFYNVSETHLLSATEWVTTNRWSKQILTYAGKKDSSELTFEYNPAWQSLDVVSAVVSNRNGTVHNVTPKEIQRMDAGWAAGAPRYPAAKQLIVNLPGVEVGSIITVTMAWTQKNAPFFSTAYFFGSGDLLDTETFTLEYPKNLPMQVRKFSGERCPEAAPGTLVHHTDTSDDVIRETWTASDMTPIAAEGSLPPAARWRAGLQLTTGNWKSHTAAIRKAIRTAQKESSVARTTAKQWTKDVSGERAKALTIRNTLARTIRITGPSFLALPLDAAFSAPDRTLADQYGHAADYVILLASMLDAVGIDTEFRLASGDTRDDKLLKDLAWELPDADAFPHLVLLAEIDDEDYVFGTENEFAELGATAFNTADALTLDGKRTTLYAQKQNTNSVDYALDVFVDGTVRFTVTNYFYGTSVAGFRKMYQEMLPEDRSRHFQDLLSVISEAATPTSELVTDTSSYPGVRSFAAVVDDYAVIEKDTITLTLPMLLDTPFSTRGNTRTLPMYFSTQTPSITRCVVRLPEGYTCVEVMPKPLFWTLPGGLGTVAMASVQNGNVLTLSVSSNRASAMLPPEMYPSVLEYNRRASHPDTLTVVVRKTTGK